MLSLLRRFKRILIFVPLFVAGLHPVAQANYDGDCLSALRGGVETPLLVQSYKAKWLEFLHDQLEIERPVSEVEFEALMDLIHDLPLVATFADGQRSILVLGDASLENLRTRLAHSAIVRVEHIPRASRKIAMILKAACQTLGRPDCELYDHDYPGLEAPARRPFSPREEQMIKWATLHQLPSDPDKATLARLAWQKITEDYQKQTFQNQTQAGDLIMATLSRAEAEKLLGKYIYPLIQAAFERLEALVSGQRMH